MRFKEMPVKLTFSSSGEILICRKELLDSSSIAVRSW